MPKAKPVEVEVTADFTDLSTKLDDAELQLFRILVLELDRKVRELTDRVQLLEDKTA